MSRRHRPWRCLRAGQRRRLRRRHALVPGGVAAGGRRRAARVDRALFVDDQFEVRDGDRQVLVGRHRGKFLKRGT